MGFLNSGTSTYRNKLQTHMQALRLDPPPPCLGAQLVWEPGLLPPLPSQQGPSEGSGASFSEGHASPGSKGDWKHSPISTYFYTEIETGEKAHPAFLCNRCVASRSGAAGGDHCGGFPHLLGFSSLLR